MKASQTALLSVILTAGCLAAQKASLFDGHSLHGWQNFGGGKFYVEDGAIVGEAVIGPPNSFLATTAVYGDFELTLEMKIDPDMNSGVQFRSNLRPEEITTQRWSGEFRPDGSKDIQTRVWEKGRFWGYQVDIDERKPLWNGVIYEEAGRGYLHPPPAGDVSRAPFKPGEWNRLRIVAVGDHLQSWLNGVLVAEINDSMTKTGYIALQLHGIGQNRQRVGQKVRFRNIELSHR